MTKSSNVNQIWANLIVEELIRNGVDYFCLAPGSRSSPLAVAVALNSRAKSFVHFDERGLGFHALGYTAATRKACAVITTSGTAVANLLPAVIETSKKKLPLIILTADRPPELRATGANQTIDQVGIFGQYVRFFFDMPCPTTDITPSFVLTTIDQAVSRANGELKGPVHLNCMFREPLAPIPAKENISSYTASLKFWQNQKAPYTSYAAVVTKPDAIDDIAARLKAIKRGIIVVGKLGSEADQKAVLALSEKMSWPIFADVTSGLRLGCSHKNVIAYFDQVLLSQKNGSVDGVLHLGGRMTSKRFYDFIEQNRPAEYVMVLNHPLRNDPLHGVTLRVQSRVADFCAAMIPKASPGPGSFLNGWQKLNSKAGPIIEEYFAKAPQLSEAAAVRLVTQTIPAGDGLFLASSLPIRHADMYADPHGKAVTIGANRGTSGIDGTLACACGFATGLQKRTTLIIGDLALLHDLNSLAMLKTAPQPLIIVALNNDGGGIFSFLPIAQFKNGFEKFFGTPHGLTFQGAAEMFDLNYSCPSNREEFVQTYKIALAGKTSTLIEIRAERKDTLAGVKGLQERIAKELEHNA